MLIFLSFLISSALAESISDNSFLLEEAYNQEPGVYQLIQTYQFIKTDDTNSTGTYALAVEMPLGSEKHQLSVTMPVQNNEVASKKNSGVADTALAYRYQLFSHENFVFTPRASLLIPTGNKDDGFGTGAVGLQIAAALSLQLQKYFVNHWNFGFTFGPHAKTVSTNFATSLVWLFSDTLNFLTEFVHTSNETAAAGGTKSRTESYYLNPGVRFAHNFGETQVVPGISFPIGIASSEAEDYGILVYLSVEGKPF